MYSIVPRTFLNPMVPSVFPNMWNDVEELLAPATDSGISIYEDEKHVYVEAAVPGVDPKDIELTFDRGVLWITAENKEEEKKGKKKYITSTQRSYAYRVAVPGDIDLGVEPQATYARGIMTVAFTKLSSAQPKKIPLKVTASN